MTNPVYTVADLARIVGASPSNIYYWVRRGLLKPARRSNTGLLLFDEAGLRELRTVMALKTNHVRSIADKEKALAQATGRVERSNPASSSPPSPQYLELAQRLEEEEVPVEAARLAVEALIAARSQR